MTPHEALDLLDEATKEVTGTRDMHIKLIDAVRTLKEALEVLK